MTSIKAAKNRPWYVRYRFTAVAACFALVILAISYTPLGNLFTPPQEDTVISEQTEDSAPSTTMRTMPSPDDTDVPQTAKSTAPDLSDQPAAFSAVSEPQEENTPSFDPSLLPQTPYEKNFAKYLTFSAKEAPTVLHSITSDRTIDHTVYYIVTSEQLTAVQSALLEDGIEVQVIPGDPNTTESLLILTITE